MCRKSIGWFVVAALLALPVYADKKCSLQQYGELPVTMSGTRPLVSGTINGSPATFLADSGAFFSMLSREAAGKFQLKVGMLPPQITVRGTGGTEDAKLTNVKEFSLAGFRGGHIFNNVDFVVGGNASLAGDVDGLIGQNVIGSADTEFDLANGFIRIFHAKDCSGKTLAYWPNGGIVAEMNIEKRTPLEPHLIGEAKINGKKIRVMFDSGAWRSILNLKAAARAGIKPDDEGVTAAGIGHGIGKQTHENWLARFDSLDLGGELIKNARLRIGDINLSNTADMLLGADFFLSHRIYVASDQHKIYFTYNGGPVFDLRANNTDKKMQTATVTTTEPAATGATETHEARDNSLDAAALRRRGAASAGRQDFQSAIADFDQAIKLDANDPENYYQRGLARWKLRQPLQARDDFDQALQLKPDYVDALMTRGRFRLGRKNDAGARADFDAAAALTPNDPSVRLSIAQSFAGAGSHGEAIARLNAWIAANPKDDRLATALNDRCWSRAMLGKELDLALADCNAALKKGPRDSQVLDSRAFAFLRLGDFDKSIVDYQAALKLQPKKALSLYGLGLAELRKGLKTEGDKDIQAAIAIEPTVAALYEQIGLKP